MPYPFSLTEFPSLHPHSSESLARRVTWTVYSAFWTLYVLIYKMQLHCAFLLGLCEG